MAIARIDSLRLLKSGWVLKVVYEAQLVRMNNITIRKRTNLLKNIILASFAFRSASLLDSPYVAETFRFPLKKWKAEAFRYLLKFLTP
jgi:hypothetical protein